MTNVANLHMFPLRLITDLQMVAGPACCAPAGSGARWRRTGPHAPPHRAPRGTAAPAACHDLARANSEASVRSGLPHRTSHHVTSAAQGTRAGSCTTGHCFPLLPVRSADSSAGVLEMRVSHAFQCTLQHTECTHNGQTGIIDAPQPPRKR